MLDQPVNEKWELCLRKFRDNLPQEQFNAWFKPITYLGYENDTLTVGVPSEYFKEHLETTYLRLLSFTLRHVYGPTVKLMYKFRVVSNEPDSTVTMTGSNQSPALANRTNAANPFRRGAAAANTEIDSQLNPRYNFQNYCVGECNQLASAIGEAIVKNPTCQTYNPLFVFGPPGVGKTHLAQAIGIAIKENDPRRRVLYVTARLFENQFTTANARGRINDFMAFYENIDTLIIDDIQDFIGKPATQRTFFHVFNHLHLNSRQLIMTSDVRPSDMDNMEERLLSRFKWGMTCELFRPDYMIRREVLVRKAEQDGLNLPADVLDFIAENVTASFRELEGIVVALMAHATILNRAIDVELAKSVIGNAVKIRRKTVNFEMIAEQVSEFYNIQPDALFTKSRKRDISDARQLVMYMTKKHTNLSVNAIGTRLCRTHATVLHAVNTIENRLATEAKLRADISSIEAALIPH